MNLEIFSPVSPRDASGVEKSSLPLVATRARKILVAEDDEVIRPIISNVLTGDGFAVNVTADGEQAWEALRRDHYDLLVTDNQMPRLTGRRLIGRIREAGMSLPIIVVSGSFPTEAGRDHPELRIDAVLPKPFAIPMLLDAVRIALSSGGDTAADSAHPPISRPSTTEPLNTNN